MLQRIAEAVGDALGEQALEQLAIRKHDKPDNEADAQRGNFDLSANRG
ncbi:MAG: hypothetical protein OXT74_04035 [Candidatus Poribacteria bacterium]|nr:hypothetical protein [Candidatus Poribacteria bacterium]